MLLGKRCCYQYYRMYPQPKRTNGLRDRIFRRLSRLSLLSSDQISPNSSTTANQTLVNTFNLLNISMNPARKEDFRITNRSLDNDEQRPHLANNGANVSLEIKDNVINDLINVSDNEINVDRKGHEDAGEDLENSKKGVKDLLFRKFPIGRTTTIGFNNGFWTGTWGGFKNSEAVLSDAQLYDNSGNMVGSSQSMVQITINRIIYVV